MWKVLGFSKIIHMSNVCEDVCVNSGQIETTLVSDGAKQSDFDLTHSQQLLRVGTTMKDFNTTLGTTLEEIGEAASFYLSLTHAAVQYLQNKPKLVISSRPDKLTAKTLQALSTCKTTSLNFFRTRKSYEVAALFFKPEQGDLIERFVEAVSEMLKRADGMWDAELIHIMTDNMAPLAKEMEAAINQLPDFDPKDAESFKNYQGAVTKAKISELSAQLQKRVEASKHCCKLAGVESSFADTFLDCAKRGLAVVAALSIQLLFNSPAWTTVTAESVKVQNSMEQKLMKNLEVNERFIRTQQLVLPKASMDELEMKLKICRGDHHEGDCGSGAGAGPAAAEPAQAEPAEEPAAVSKAEQSGQWSVPCAVCPFYREDCLPHS